LVNALDRGSIRGAGIDVLENEDPDLSGCNLLGRQNVIITPHSAFYSQESIEKLQRISGANLGYFLAGKNEEITELV
jgi:D-3-phosphoglycerate dehydrogenase